jgi:glycosyltransferase involved in cell wall biosynthesis
MVILIRGTSMQSNPLISVLVTLYNSEKFLDYSLFSLLNQSYSNLQIIVCDDGSIDNTLQIVKGINDERIYIISQENRGKNAALNTCLAHATGEWITIFDHDDYYHKDYFKNLVNSILIEADAIVGSFKYVKEYNESAICDLIEPTENRIIIGQEITMEYFQNAKFNIYLWNKLFRKEVFSGFVFPEEYTLDDLSSTHLLLSKCRVAVINSNSVYYHFIQPNSLAKKDNHSQKFIFEVTKLYYDRFIYYENLLDENLFSVLLIQTYPNILWGLLKLYRLNFKSGYIKEFEALVKENYGNYINNTNQKSTFIINLIYEIYFISEPNKINRYLKKTLVNFLYYLNKMRYILSGNNLLY